jgi:hypothetical protein
LIELLTGGNPTLDHLVPSHNGLRPQRRFIGATLQTFGVEVAGMRKSELRECKCDTKKESGSHLMAPSSSCRSVEFNAVFGH